MAPLFHGIAGVDGQIDDDLFDLAGIGPNGEGIARKRGRVLDVFADKAAEHLAEILDEAIEVEQLGFTRFLTAEKQELAGQGGGPFAGGADLADFLDQFVASPMESWRSSA
jgi:hypothetical protein